MTKLYRNLTIAQNCAALWKFHKVCVDLLTVQPSFAKLLRKIPGFNKIYKQHLDCCFVTNTDATCLTMSTHAFEVLNFTTVATNVSGETPDALWGPLSPQEYFEIFYLSIVVVLGTIGNLTVIFSIIFEDRVHAHGNIFVINLAVADLLVTGFVMPTVIVNVVAGGNALPFAACKVAGYTVTVTCTCSVANLMIIAINRYWAVVHSKTYARNFTRKRVYIMVLACWVWCNLASMPTLVGWGSIDYDEKMMLCSWNDTISISYTIFLAGCAIFIPLIVIAFCYWKLFTTVRTSGRWVRSLSVGSGVMNSEQNRRSERKERNLLQTLATTVAVFCVCWLPYAVTIIVDAKGVPGLAKKAFGWLGLSNSAVNFVIYGAMNPVFRRGYRNLYYYIFTCKRSKKVSSTGLHASQHSDSFYKSRRRSSAPGTPNSNSRLTVVKPSPMAALARHSIPAGFYTNSRSSAPTTPQFVTKNSSNNGNLQFNKRPASSAVDAPKNFGRGGDQKPRRKSEDSPASSRHFQPSPKNRTVKSTASAAAAFRRPHSLLRREKRNNQADKKATAEMEREARLKRNSLMLLQIQMSDDEEESPVIHRRTRSEIPNGTPRRATHVTTSNSVDNLSNDAFLLAAPNALNRDESDVESSRDDGVAERDMSSVESGVNIQVPFVPKESAV